MVPQERALNQTVLVCGFSDGREPFRCSKHRRDGCVWIPGAEHESTGQFSITVLDKVVLKKFNLLWLEHLGIFSPVLAGG